MKLLPFILFFTCFSCMNYSKNKIDYADSSQINLNGNIKSTKLQQGNSELNNESLWKKIVARPDSVPVLIFINDSIKATLTISGRLNTIYYTPEYIKVAFSNGMKQVLKVKGSAVSWIEGQRMLFLKNEDFNFDRQPDLQVFDNAGATGNFWYCTWLYDRNKGFVFNQDISDMSAPKIDSNNKQIISYNRLGYCEETVVYYAIQKHELKPVQYIFNQKENCKPDSGCQSCMTYKKELAGKKWKISKVGELENELYDSIYLK